MDEIFRLHQLEEILSIERSFEKNKAFLLASEVGLGKTRVSCQVAKTYSKVLVVAPISTHPGWKYEAETVGLKLHTAGIMWPGKCTLVNYEQLEKWKQIGEWNVKRKFFEAKNFDLIIWDECHKLRNTKSKRFKIFQSLNVNCTKSLFLSATPGQSPLDLCYLKDVIGFNSFWSWVRSFEGIYKNRWGGYDFRKGHATDAQRLNKIINDNPFALRRTPQDISGWPELNRIMLPINLTPSQCETYNNAMADYLEARYQSGKNGLPPGAYDMVAVGQFRKTISALKVDTTVETAKDLVEQGKAVTISCEYLIPAYDMKDRLIQSGLKVAIISGETFQLDRHEILKASSKDELDVIIFTIQEGINLQQYQDEHRERIQIDHDIRWSAIAQHQIDGRTHRAGRNAVVYWACVSNTVDERVAKVLKHRMEVMKDIQGEMIPIDDYLFGTPLAAQSLLHPQVDGLAVTPAVSSTAPSCSLTTKQ